MGNCNCRGKNDDYGSTFIESSDGSRNITLQLDRGYGGEDGKNNWPTCDYQAILKVGSKCILHNQQDVASGMPIDSIRNKNRILAVDAHLERRKRAAGAEGAVEGADCNDGELIQQEEEEEQGNW